MLPPFFFPLSSFFWWGWWGAGGWAGGDVSTMLLFCCLLYDPSFDSLQLFFCPFSRCFIPMPKFWLLLLSIFHLFSLYPASRQMGDGLLGTENVMERLSSIPLWEQAVPVIFLCKQNTTLEYQMAPSWDCSIFMMFWRVLEDVCGKRWYRTDSLDLTPLSSTHLVVLCIKYLVYSAF